VGGTEVRVGTDGVSSGVSTVGGAVGCSVLVGGGVFVAVGCGVLVGGGVGVAVGAKVSVGTAVGDDVTTAGEHTRAEVWAPDVANAVTTGCGVAVGVSAAPQP